MDKKLQLHNIIQNNILECAPTESLRTVIKRMNNRKCSSILVVECDKPVGIWTEHDALKLDLNDVDCTQNPISHYMSAPVKTISGNLSLEETSVAFKGNNIRHYLVLGENNKRLGIVTQTDIILNQDVNYFLFLKKVSNIIISAPGVTADTPLSEATRMMSQYNTDALAVLDSSKPPGILSERDVIHAIASNKGNCSVDKIATPDMMTISMNETIYSARNIMIKNGFRHIGVTDTSGRFIGIISFSDVLKSIVDGYYQYLNEELIERTEDLSVAKENLALSNKIIETAQDGVMVTDQSAIIQSVNPAFTTITGYLPEEVIGMTPDILKSGRHNEAFFEKMWKEIKSTGHWRGEIWNRRKNGEIYPTILTISKIVYKDRKSVHYATLFSDITTLKNREENAKRLALYDSLTGLPNRRLLEDRIKHTLASGTRYQEKCGALLFIDLDHFKPVNDSFGHGIGDRLLLEVAARLTRNLRKEDTAARLGGDEFIILLPNLGNQMNSAIDQAESIAKKMLKEIDTSFLIEGHDLRVTSSIGITMFQGERNHFETLLKQADTAMYRAKKDGRNRFCRYDANH